jgi:lysophospholipid acyltransferase (LPLAT)-like uncharacterized protein
MLKRLITQNWFQEFVAFLVFVYVELVRHSIRWEVRGEEHINKVWDEKLSILGVVWHGRILMALQGWRKDLDRMVALASRSAEGNIGQKLIRWYGARVVRGSSRNHKKPQKNKGGEAGYRGMCAHLEAGGCGVVTPDGPRGPRMRVSYGAIRMASDTGVPILPFNWSTKRKWVMHKSWDHQCLPQFFTKGIIIWGEPIHIGKNLTPAELEAARLMVETRMIEMSREADIAMGGEIVEPSDELRVDPKDVGK